MKAIAKAQRAAFVEEQSVCRERTAAKNREYEQALCEQIDAEVTGTGRSWERISKLVDLQVPVFVYATWRYLRSANCCWLSALFPAGC